MSRFHSIVNYAPKESDVFLFDTNAWMLIASPLGGYSEFRVKKYSSFFSAAVKAGSTICISSLIVSEIINAYLRLEFNIWKSNGNDGKDFKRDFKNTEEYGTGVDEISTILKKQILSVAVKIDDKFSEFSSDSLITYLRAIDFNDHYYLNLAKKVGLKIVTDDGDFNNPAFDAEIITGNPRLLGSR